MTKLKEGHVIEYRSDRVVSVVSGPYTSATGHACVELRIKIEPITTKQDGLQKIANYNEGCSNALSIKWCN